MSNADLLSRAERIAAEWTDPDYGLVGHALAVRNLVKALAAADVRVAELEAEVAKLRKTGGALATYAEWQIADGAAYHPTLPSALQAFHAAALAQDTDT